MRACWEAPGRVNLIGEHLDYNGGSVLPFAIDLTTRAAVTTTDAGAVRIRSEGLGETVAEWPLRADRIEPWARYIAGAVWAFSERFPAAVGGLDIEVASRVPVGSGLSSSAAVECAVICALDDLASTALPRESLAELALRAERDFVGVPCGPMDQLASMLGEADHALHLDTRTLRATPVPLALAEQGLALLVVDTGVQHAVGEGQYADRRAACERAAALLGLTHLVDASPESVERLADSMLRRRARHVVSENGRVEQSVALLAAGRVAEVGPLLTASHRSLADDFEVSCPELDLVVSTALASGALGARMTGAGFGGSAIVLCGTGQVDRLQAALAAAFDDAGSAPPRSWPARPSPGARRCWDR